MSKPAVWRVLLFHRAHFSFVFTLPQMSSTAPTATPGAANFEMSVHGKECFSAPFAWFAGVHYFFAPIKTAIASGSAVLPYMADKYILAKSRISFAICSSVISITISYRLTSYHSKPRTPHNPIYCLNHHCAKIEIAYKQAFNLMRKTQWRLWTESPM